MAKVADSEVRRHLTIVLPDGGLLDPIQAMRARWDPVMAAGVSAHVSVVYPEEVTDDAELLERAAAEVVRRTGGRRLRPMPGPGNADPLEAALDELYGVEPADFVETRKQLAAELRAVGNKEAAKSVLAARRPTTAAWALNQLPRTEPALVEAFLERSRDLQAAQTGALAGGREAMRDATRAQRRALADATEAAVAALGDRATDGFRTQILSTLHAASSDEGVADQLRQGRLVREVSSSTGFPEGPSLTLVPDLEERPRPAAPRRQQRAPAARPERPTDEEAELAKKRRLELERAALEQSKQRLATAEAGAKSAQDAAVAAEVAAAAMRARVVQLQDDLDAARREARAAEDTAARARRDATRLARAATKLRSRE